MLADIKASKALREILYIVLVAGNFLNAVSDSFIICVLYWCVLQLNDNQTDKQTEPNSLLTPTDSVGIGVGY